MALERWLERRWYGGEPPGMGLRALAGAYRVARGLRAGEAPQCLPVPVLVAGNFTAGGTGKTPLVIALARELSARGWRPGIVSRGHGRMSPRVLLRMEHVSGAILLLAALWFGGRIVLQLHEQHQHRKQMRQEQQIIQPGPS